MRSLLSLLAMSVVAVGCQRAANQAAVNLAVKYNFKAGCLTVTSVDTADRTKTVSAQVAAAALPPASNATPNTVNFAVFRNDDWGRRDRGHHRAARGLVPGHDRREERLDGGDAGEGQDHRRGRPQGRRRRRRRVRRARRTSPGTDCDDGDSARAPNVAEVCDLKDNDCNNLPDDGLPTQTYFRDNDGDGVGTSASKKDACAAPAGYVLASAGADCDDANPARTPGKAEVCDNFDNNCGTASTRASTGPGTATTTRTATATRDLSASNPYPTPSCTKPTGSPRATSRSSTTTATTRRARISRATPRSATTSTTTATRWSTRASTRPGTPTPTATPTGPGPPRPACVPRPRASPPTERRLQRRRRHDPPGRDREVQPQGRQLRWTASTRGSAPAPARRPAPTGSSPAAAPGAAAPTAAPTSAAPPSRATLGYLDRDGDGQGKDAICSGAAGVLNSADCDDSRPVQQDARHRGLRRPRQQLRGRREGRAATSSAWARSGPRPRVGSLRHWRSVSTNGTTTWVAGDADALLFIQGTTATDKSGDAACGAIDTRRGCGRARATGPRSSAAPGGALRQHDKARPAARRRRPGRLPTNLLTGIIGFEDAGVDHALPRRQRRPDLEVGERCLHSTSSTSEAHGVQRGRRGRTRRRSTAWATTTARR